VADIACWLDYYLRLRIDINEVVARIKSGEITIEDATGEIFILDRTRLLGASQIDELRTGLVALIDSRPDEFANLEDSNKSLFDQLIQFRLQIGVPGALSASRWEVLPPIDASPNPLVPDGLPSLEYWSDNRFPVISGLNPEGNYRIQADMWDFPK